MQGWIKLHRALIKKTIWRTSSPEQKTVLMTILMLVAYTTGHAEVCGHMLEVKPGEMVISQRQLAQEAGVSHKILRGSLLRFERLGFLTLTGSGDKQHYPMRLKVNNWDKYQSSSPEKSKGKDVVAIAPKTGTPLGTPDSHDMTDFEAMAGHTTGHSSGTARAQLKSGIALKNKRTADLSQNFALKEKNINNNNNKINNQPTLESYSAKKEPVSGAVAPDTRVCDGFYAGAETGLAEEALTVAQALDTAGSINKSWIKGFFRLEGERIRRERPEMAESSIIECWKEALLSGIAANASSPVWYQKAFQGILGKFRPGQASGRYKPTVSITLSVKEQEAKKLESCIERLLASKVIQSVFGEVTDTAGLFHDPLDRMYPIKSRLDKGFRIDNPRVWQPVSEPGCRVDEVAV